MKLYITGSVGSGKSVLAEEISNITGIPCVHLDEIVHIPCNDGLYGNIRRSDDEINNMFHSVICRDDYIIEDNAREIFIDGMKNADIIIVLDIPLMIRKYRIIKRWLNQRLGFEECIYNTDLKVMKAMFRWLNNYESGQDGAKARINRYKDKAVYLKTRSEVNGFIEKFRETGK